MPIATANAMKKSTTNIRSDRAGQTGRSLDESLAMTRQRVGGRDVDRLVILASCPGAMAGVDWRPGATCGRSPSWTTPGDEKESTVSR